MASTWTVLALTCLVAGVAAQEERRSPSMGFMGMRGKKSPRLEDETILEEYKRAPSMGFQGMRGKKAPSMGFMGMRGKKDDLDLWDEEKRAPSAGFFGMRGKKTPGAGFFGMRGKKGPNSGFFGTRGKKGPSGFMGVRGKKDGPQDIDSLLQFLRESEARQEIEDLMDSRAKRFTEELQEMQDEPQFV